MTHWQFWWAYNKDPYLELRARIHLAAPRTGDADFFVGHGQTTASAPLNLVEEDVVRDSVVPALLEVLDKETNNDLVTGALIALAKIGEDPAAESGRERHPSLTPAIASFLPDAVQEIRETAALSLGILGGPAAVEMLEHLARDDEEGRSLLGRRGEVDLRTRTFAVYGLGVAGHDGDGATRRRVIRILADLLEARRMATRDVKAAAVISMGLVPAELVPVEETSTRNRRRRDPARSRADQILYLLELLRNESAHHHVVRAHAPRSLVLLLEGAPESSREVVGRALLKLIGPRARGVQRELRQSATLALGGIGDADGDELDAKIHARLLEAFRDPDQQTKYFSLISLAQCSGRAGEWDAPEGPYDQKRLARTRAHLGRQLSARGQAKSWAALSLGVLGRALRNGELQPPSLDHSAALRVASSRVTNPDSIGAYALAAGLRGDEEAVPGLRFKLDQISEDIARGHLAVGLGLLRAEPAVPDLREIVADSRYRPALLTEASIALALLGDKSTVPMLTEMLESSNSLSTQAALAQALGFIGDSRAISPLLRLLRDRETTSSARAFAAVALGNVAASERLPWHSQISRDLNYRAHVPTLTSGRGDGLLEIL